MMLATAVSPLNGRAEDAAPRQTIVVQLVSSGEANAPRRENPPSSKPIAVNGMVQVQVERHPTTRDLETERYSVEFYVDDQLQFQTKGEKEPTTGQPCFVWTMDSAKFPNGEHKLVINLWDKEGPAAIGIKRLVISNGGKTQP
jgi:hypothetical protein